MRVPKTLSLDFETIKKLEKMAQDMGEHQSEIVRRLISQEWQERGYTSTPQPEWHGEGIS